MAKTEVDWTFEEAPTDAEGVAEATDSLAPGGASPAGRRPRWLRREYWWRWLALTAGLALMVTAGLWLATRIGHQRVRDQVTAEVLYEDAHSRAGEAELALSVWPAPPTPLSDPSEPITAWRRQRANEISQRLSAPLPAPQLLPVEAAPQVTAVEALPDDASLWVATVVRTYTDPAGHTLSFALPQRYRNLGPGLWERVPPDADELSNTTVIAGHRLSATLPVVDLPWLTESLFATDAALVRACAEWGPEACGDAKLILIFTGRAEQLLGSAQPPPGPVAGFGPYPAAFNLPPYNPRDPAPLGLPSPHLAGLPQDEAGRAALTHALIVYGLTALAEAQAGASNSLVDYFRDALVARAELRLGLSAPPTYTLRLQDYLPIASLWEAGLTGPLVGPAAALPLRLQALTFLNGVLAGEPPTTEAALLAALRGQPGVATWLNGVLGTPRGTQAVNEWEAQAARIINQSGDRSWAGLDGLSYTCEGVSTRISGGVPLPRPHGDPGPASGQRQEALSPDGRYLATVNRQGAGQVTLLVYDLTVFEGAVPVATQTPLVVPRSAVVVAQAPEVLLVGWSQAQALVYIARGDQSGATVYKLLRFDQATGENRLLVDTPVVPGVTGRADWLPDRRSLVINVIYPEAGALFEGVQNSAPTWVPVDDAATTAPVRLAPRGYPSVLSPDGRRLAYTVPELVDTSLLFARIEVGVARDIGDRRELLTLDDLHAQPDLALIFPVGWSGDSKWVLVAGRETDGPVRVYLVAADGSQFFPLIRAEDSADLSLGLDHSADGRYLTYHLQRFGRSIVSALLLIDLEQVAATGLRTDMVRSLALDVAGTAWSPTGHRLALAGSAGLRVLDIDTGLARWVFLGQCDAVAWDALPS